MTKENQHYGFFTVTGDKLRVTDPCYSYDSDSGVTLCNVRPGKWYTEATLINRSYPWGTRVASLKVYHEDYKTEQNSCVSLTYLKPPVCVDSGQAGFFDLIKYPTINGDEKDTFYDENCNLTLSEAFGGIVGGMGVVTGSGYGDGCYDLYYDINKDGIVLEAEIVFIDLDNRRHNDDEDY